MIPKRSTDSSPRQQSSMAQTKSTLPCSNAPVRNSSSRIGEINIYVSVVRRRALWVCKFWITRPKNETSDEAGKCSLLQLTQMKERQTEQHKTQSQALCLELQISLAGVNPGSETKRVKMSSFAKHAVGKAQKETTLRIDPDAASSNSYSQAQRETGLFWSS